MGSGTSAANGRPKIQVATRICELEQCAGCLQLKYHLFTAGKGLPWLCGECITHFQENRLIFCTSCSRMTFRREEDLKKKSPVKCDQCCRDQMSKCQVCGEPRSSLTVKAGPSGDIRMCTECVLTDQQNQASVAIAEQSFHFDGLVKHLDDLHPQPIWERHSPPLTPNTSARNSRQASHSPAPSSRWSHISWLDEASAPLAPGRSVSLLRTPSGSLCCGSTLSCSSHHCGTNSTGTHFLHPDHAVSASESLASACAKRHSQNSQSTHSGATHSSGATSSPQSRAGSKTTTHRESRRSSKESSKACCFEEPILFEPPAMSDITGLDVDGSHRGERRKAEARTRSTSCQDREALAPLERRKARTRTSSGETLNLPPSRSERRKESRQEPTEQAGRHKDRIRSGSMPNLTAANALKGVVAAKEVASKSQRKSHGAMPLAFDDSASQPVRHLSGMTSSSTTPKGGTPKSGTPKSGSKLSFASLPTVPKLSPLSDGSSRPPSAQRCHTEVDLARAGHKQQAHLLESRRSSTVRLPQISGRAAAA